jgi:uncharacterized protein (DUF58 family)
MRWINNRADARFPGSLYVNEFEQERVADIGITLDVQRAIAMCRATVICCSSIVQAAVALADALIGQGNRVGLLIYGHAIEWTFPGYGKIQREKILRALAQARTGDRAALASLADIPTRLFPARSQIILINPLQPGDAIPISAYARAQLRSAGCQSRSGCLRSERFRTPGGSRRADRTHRTSGSAATSLSGWGACCRLECGDATGAGAGAYAALMNVAILCYTVIPAIMS